MQIHTKQMQYLLLNIKEFYTFAMLILSLFSTKIDKNKIPPYV